MLPKIQFSKIPDQEFSDYLWLTQGLTVLLDRIRLMREQFVVNWLHLRDIWLAHSYEWKKWEEGQVRSWDL